MDEEPSFERVVDTLLGEHGLSLDEPPGSVEVWHEFLGDVAHALERGVGPNTLILDKSFDKIVAHAVDGFILHDTRGQILDFNQAACDMLGYTRAELADLEVADFETDIKPGAFWEDMTVDQVFTVEGVHQRKDGSTYPVETRVGAFMVDDEKVCLALCRDITRRKHVEEELKLANARLQVARDEAVRANQAKSSFLASMSHELRTPLNAVIGYSEFLIEEMTDDGDDTYIDDLERIRTAGSHLLSLINDVLDLSKIEAGKTELDITEFDLAEMVAAIESTASPLASKNGDRLVVDIDDELPQMRSDVTKIRQILLNLLANACKFTQDGEVRLRVRCDADKVGFEVCDDGVGMDQEALERIFEAFQQAEASTTRNFGGTGLGLAISKHYCEMLGGEIGVESTPGEGTTFRVVLPLSVER